MFDKASVFKRLQYSYNDEPLAAKLRVEFNARSAILTARRTRRSATRTCARC